MLRFASYIVYIESWQLETKYKETSYRTIFESLHKTAVQQQAIFYIINNSTDAVVSWTRGRGGGGLVPPGQKFNVWGGLHQTEIYNV